MSEAESDHHIVELLRQRKDAKEKLSHIRAKLMALGSRLQRLGEALASGDASLEAQSDLLKFGPESGINAEGLAEILREQSRLRDVVKNCGLGLRQLGIDIEV